VDLQTTLDNLLTPQILFFFLGALAVGIRSDLEIPPQVTKALSIFLLFSIGMHGGVELAESTFSARTVGTLLTAMATSALFPLATFFLFRRRLGAADAAGIAATYGSISAVTFITATSFLDDRGVVWSGHMVAAMALMESPAVIVGVLLARRFGGDTSDPAERAPLKSLFHEALTNGSVYLLLGSLVIGLATGHRGWESVKPLAGEPFKGVLCLFLLDMGLIAARRVRALKDSGPQLVGYALVAPLVHAAIAIGLGWSLGIDKGDALLLVVLCASASYIAVPAALRMSLPEANPSLYLPMSLAVTFPFNIALGIPIYFTVIERLWGSS
jgi:hypothetical protein